MSSVKEERVKQYFVNAAMEIIRAEGIEAASARTIAERAGYSYATIYNYFDDIDALLFHAIQGFMQECSDFVEENIQKAKNEEKMLYNLAKVYSAFFLQYPALLKLLHCQKINMAEGEKCECTLPENFFTELAEKHCTMDTASAEYKRYNYALHGFLIFSLLRAKSVDYKKFIKLLEEITL